MIRTAFAATRPVLCKSATTTTTSAATTPTTKVPGSFRLVRERFARQAPKVIFDTLSPTPSHLLDLALLPHLPPDVSRSTYKDAAQLQHPFALPDHRAAGGPLILPQGHHLVYFPLQEPASSLLPDGTDASQAPGGIYTRRMWAGGSLKFADTYADAFRLDGRRVCCVEVFDKERESAHHDPHFYLTVRRRYGLVDPSRGPDADLSTAEALRFGEKGAILVEETRKLVFLNDTIPSSRPKNDAFCYKHSGRNPPMALTFTVKPDRTLLFHFSALSYNAHAIHFDPEYARLVEGYKAPLVHGPLSLVLIMSALRAVCRSDSPYVTLDTKRQKSVVYIKSVDYRNISPLYVDEELTLFLRRLGPRKGDEEHWLFRIEAPGRRVAVRGSAVLDTVSA
ncbi:hypothetical protein B0T22DRAFT_374160, partial [Podospora appendiculata]